MIPNNKKRKSKHDSTPIKKTKTIVESITDPIEEYPNTPEHQIQYGNPPTPDAPLRGGYAKAKTLEHEALNLSPIPFAQPDPDQSNIVQNGDGKSSWDDHLLWLQYMGNRTERLGLLYGDLLCSNKRIFNITHEIEALEREIEIERHKSSQGQDFTLLLKQFK